MADELTDALVSSDDKPCCEPAKIRDSLATMTYPRGKLPGFFQSVSLVTGAGLFTQAVSPMQSLMLPALISAGICGVKAVALDTCHFKVDSASHASFASEVVGIMTGWLISILALPGWKDNEIAKGITGTFLLLFGALSLASNFYQIAKHRMYRCGGNIYPEDPESMDLEAPRMGR